MPFEPIRRILPQAIAQAGIQKQVTAVSVAELARTTMTALWGVEQASLFHVHGFSAGELRLETTSPSASQHLKIESVRLQNELNRRLGKKEVVKISCRLSSHGTLFA